MGYYRDLLHSLGMIVNKVIFDLGHYSKLIGLSCHLSLDIA